MVPKVSAVLAVSAVAMALLMKTVVPLMAVIIEPAGTLVPLTVSPTTRPVVLLTTKLLVWAAPPLATVTPVAAVVT